MREKLKTAFKYTVMMVIAVALLWLSFKDVQWTEFWAGVKACRWAGVVFSMVVSIVAFWLRSIRWREMLLPIDSSTRGFTCFNAVNIGYIVNIVLPRVGELVRCGYITKHSAYDSGGKKLATYDKVLGTAVADRMWDAFMLVLLVGIVMLVSAGSYGSFFSEKVIAPLSSSLNLSLGWLLAVVCLFLATALWAVVHFRSRNELCAKIFKPLHGIWQGISSCLRMRIWWKFLILTMMVWGCYWLMSAGILWAVQGMDTAKLSISMASYMPELGRLDLWDALFLMLVGGVSSAVPVPGGFGAFHYLVSLAILTLYGIPMEFGVVFATLSHESQIITEIACGGFSYAWEALHPEKKL